MQEFIQSTSEFIILVGVPSLFIFIIGILPLLFKIYAHKIAEVFDTDARNVLRGGLVVYVGVLFAIADYITR
jgi:hypothetical protein